MQALSIDIFIDILAYHLTHVNFKNIIFVAQINVCGIFEKYFTNYIVF